MAVKRKGRSMRRRAVRKSRSMVPRRSLRYSGPKVNVTRTWYSGNWVPGTTNTVDFWRYLTMSLSNIPNVSEYTALFDSYRVNTVTFILRPRYDSFAGNDTTDTTLPGVTNQGGNHVHVIIDPKSPILPSGVYNLGNLNTYLENGKVRTYDGHKTIKIRIKYPCIPDDVNGISSAEFKRSPFLSTVNTGILYRGAHVFIQDVNMTGIFGQSYDVFVTANVTFKGMR